MKFTYKRGLGIQKSKGGALGMIAKGIRKAAGPFVRRAEKVDRYKRDRNTKMIEENFGSVENYKKTLATPKKAKRY